METIKKTGNKKNTNRTEENGNWTEEQIQIQAKQQPPRGRLSYNPRRLFVPHRRQCRGTHRDRVTFVAKSTLLKYKEQKILTTGDKIKHLKKRTIKKKKDISPIIHNMHKIQLYHEKVSNTYHILLSTGKRSHIRKITKQEAEEIAIKLKLQINQF